jgi:nucleotide-binding universal stress UspA family protein
MKRILVAIDGSKASKQVVEYAIGLAKSMSVGISLFYAVPELGVPSDYKQYAKIEMVDSAAYYDEVGKRIVDDFGGEVRASGVDCDASYEVGPAFEKILKAVEDSKADMVVMGLRGLHGLGRVRALGSTARRVMENSRVPVVVVPT